MSAMTRKYPPEIQSNSLAFATNHLIEFFSMATKSRAIQMWRFNTNIKILLDVVQTQFASIVVQHFQFIFPHFLYISGLYSLYSFLFIFGCVRDAHTQFTKLKRGPPTLSSFDFGFCATVPFFFVCR